MRLTTKRPPSRGLISSSLKGEEVCDELLLGEEGGECSLSTSPLEFKNMFLFEGQLEALCPKPKHLKHLIELVLGS